MTSPSSQPIINITLAGGDGQGVGNTGGAITLNGPFKGLLIQ
jgi:hypothetical protein